MLTVWGRRTSSNVQAVMWGIAELGLDCTRHDVGHRYGGTDTDAFYAMNPNRTVPVLQDGEDAPLWESAAILRYLANRYGSAPFWPEDVAARAQVDKWAEWAKINVGGAFTVPIFWRVVRTPEAKRDWPAIRAAVVALEKALAIAEARLEGCVHLAGENFTLADVQFGHVLYRYYEIGIERADLPNVARYYARLQERPAYREHVMVSYAELAV
ncbi:glutathione S-transferase [Roseovarius sp. HI0049]|nr:glutathione S-transferase [Roseovarius sp. HI0049]